MPSTAHSAKRRHRHVRELLAFLRSYLPLPTRVSFMRSPERSGRGVATQTKPADDSRDLELLDQLSSARRALVEQIGRRIIGQHKIVDDLVAALLAGGHALLVGVPGLAKTLLVQTVAQALDLELLDADTATRALANLNAWLTQPDFAAYRPQLQRYKSSASRSGKPGGWGR